MSHANALASITLHQSGMLCNFCPSTFSRLFNCESTEPNSPKNRNRETDLVPARTSEEAKTKMKAWRGILHKRVYSMWKNNFSVIDRYLAFILQNVAADEDPVSPANNEKCVMWQGGVSEEGGYAVMPIFDGIEEKSTYVLRMLSFLFAESGCFDLLVKNTPKGPLHNVCDNEACVNMMHIIVGA